jgi:trk system potassium uptake protein TrkA
VIDSAVNNYDVIGISGNGASYRVQQEAGVGRADLLIAATSSDELNILCCLTAKKLGVHSTIARVRNPEYSEQLVFMREELGLSMVVNPEMEAAREIARNLSFPAAIKIDDFAKGRAELAEIRVLPGNPLCGKPLSALYETYKVKILVCAVQREGEVYIPDGNFVLQAGDKIHITATHASLISFLRSIGVMQDKIKSVFIVGGGKVTFYLALLLEKRGIAATIVEQNPSAAWS